MCRISGSLKMALHTKQSACVSCGLFNLSDVTGPYDPSANPGGYGGENEGFGQVEPYTASIFFPKGTEPALVKDLNANPPAPDDNGHYKWTFTPVAFGLPEGSTIPSGVWTVKINFGVTERSFSVLVFNDIESRVVECVCRDPKKVTLWAYLQAAKMVFSHFKTQEAQVMIDRLYKQTECCAKGC